MVRVLGPKKKYVKLADVSTTQLAPQSSLAEALGFSGHSPILMWAVLSIPITLELRGPTVTITA